MKKILLLVFLLPFLSCNVVDDENTADVKILPKEFSTSSLNNFLNLHTMTNNKAISPNCISHLDANNNFSVGIVCNVKDMFAKETSKAKVKVKYYLPVIGQAAVVCSVSKSDSVIFWKALPLDSTVAINKWIDREFDFVFPETYKDNEILSVYVWAPYKDELYVEDLYVKP
jgi:hypothetical protein